MQRLRSKLTYANVMVSILAFVVLGGGTALGAIVVSDNSQVAAGTISGHAPPSGKRPNIINKSVNAQDLANGAAGPAVIRNNAVSSAKVAPNSLTGANINESTLGTVPNATNATNATNSSTVGGLSVKKVFFKAAPNTAPTLQFSAVGLNLALGCNAGGDPTATVTSDSNGVALQGNAINSGGTQVNYSQSAGFTNTNIISTSRGSGRLTFSNNAGDTLTMMYGYDDNNTLGGQNLCTFRGTVISG